MSDGGTMAAASSEGSAPLRHSGPAPGDLRQNPVILALVTGIVGPVLLVVGIVYTGKALAAQRNYAHAQRVTATVVDAQYVKADRSQAERIVVAVKGSAQTATIDDVASAPDHLTLGEAVNVLVSPRRPGHALFPSQQARSKLMLPIGAIGAGMVGLGAFAWSVVRTRRLIRQQRESS